MCPSTVSTRTSSHTSRERRVDAGDAVTVVPARGDLRSSQQALDDAEVCCCVVPFAHHGQVTTRHVLPGALLATGCWLGLQALGGVYVTQVLAGSSQAYGASLPLWACSWLLIAFGADPDCGRAQRRARPQALAALAERGAVLGGQTGVAGLGARCSARFQAADCGQTRAAARRAERAGSRRRAIRRGRLTAAREPGHRRGRDAPYQRESPVVPGEGRDTARTRRFVRRPSHDTRLQFVQRIGDAYGLVLVLILTAFVVTMSCLRRAGSDGSRRSRSPGSRQSSR